jgi:putative FmdB family regulatory protein
MPTYEYLCQKCSHRFETWQKMTDEPLTTCDECGGPIRRILFPAGIVFKGSGFYKTDHASSSNGNGTNGHNGHNGHDSHKSKSDGESTSTESKSSGESKSSENGSKTSSTSESKATT